MIWWICWTLIGLYAAGFCFTFWINASAGPITVGLAVFRAIVWPLWMATGWPQGEPV
jgi:hypothetical protein